MAEPSGLLFDKPVKMLIVVAQSGLDRLAPAQEAARAAGAEVEVVEVPGVLDVPVAIAFAERLADFDGYIALSGGNDRDEVLHVAWHAVSLLGLDGACIGNGLGKSGNDGKAAAIAALHLVAISRKWAAQTKVIGFRA